MATALWIAHVTVTDEDAYMKYAALATEAIAQHGGTFLARGGQAIQKEGRAHPRNVVARFPSLEVPFTRTNICLTARGASERDLVLVEELG